MQGEYTEVRFEQLLAEPVRNGIYKSKEFHGSGAKVVNMGELFAYPRLRSVPMKRVRLSASEAERFLVESGDLLFARRSLVAEGAGKCSVVLETDEPTTFESSIIRARPDPEKVVSLYLYYFFSSPLGLHRLGTIRRQVAVAGITGSDLAKLDVLCPPIAQQHAIAHILGTLDDKIELNRRMSETLEKMARALFRSWFVDFDPVRAKMEGRDPGLPSEIADLFPHRLVDSELGEIPEGWKVASISRVAEHPRRSVQPDSIEPGTHYVALEHIPRRRLALDSWGEATGVESNKFAFKHGEILFGKLRPYFHKVVVAPIDGVCSTDIVVVRPTVPDWFSVVMGHVSSVAFVEFTNAGSTGTRMPRTSWQEMSRYQVPLPPQPLAASCTRLIRPIVERIHSAIHQSRTLIGLRDALLPQLISGQLRVSDAERLLASAPI
jgi:type I restriction enzyme S subunit